MFTGATRNGGPPQKNYNLSYLCACKQLKRSNSFCLLKSRFKQHGAEEAADGSNFCIFF